MIKNAAGLWLVLFFVVVGVNGQSMDEIREKYGQPVEAYSVSEHIWMTPKFTADGRICSMRLYPKRVSPTTVYLGDKLDKWELEAVINKLVPSESRGNRSDFSGFSNFMGAVYSKVYVYENVSFKFLVPFNTYKIKIKKSNSKSNKKDTNEEEELSNTLIVPNNTVIAIITWNEKKCAE